jgi:hypothetical protein
LSIFTIKYLYRYVYKDLTMLLLLSKGGWIHLAKKTTRMRSLPMVSGRTVMKLKHTLKDVMSLLSRHRDVFSPSECMTGHRLSHALLCSSLECIRSCTMIMPIFLKMLIASKTRKQRSPNTSKLILIYPLTKEVTYMDFPSVFTWTNGTKEWTIR